ncbi:MAG: hypothetical protein PHQ57_02805 [Candidatus Omnitrophica bacterium]|nr:hypothetical protein [Candidatus Omnitrophota bacterium]
MKNLKVFVCVVAILVFLICLYSFLLGNEVFKGKFSNEAVPWYFLAKGLFCSVALYLMINILEVLRKK